MTHPHEPPTTRAAVRPRTIVLLGVLAAVTVTLIVVLVNTELSGTGAENVGQAAPQTTAPATAPESVVPETVSPSASSGQATPAVPASCEATESNPGGTNSYRPDAPENEDLGEGFVITGTVRTTDGCAPLEGVRVQVWLATENGGELDNRVSVYTDANGVYQVETAPVYPQFGEPNIHVAYDDDEFGPVFLRRVVDLNLVPDA